MSRELCHAILNPSGPNYERLKEFFPDRVPLKTACSQSADLGPEKNVEVYMLDLAALPLLQRCRLLGMVAEKAGVPLRLVEQAAAESGFPIRAADVIVSYDMRAFV